MITINVSRDDSFYLKAILQGIKIEYYEGIVNLEEIRKMNPDILIGSIKQTPSEAIETTQKAIGVLDRILDQLE